MSATLTASESLLRAVLLDPFDGLLRLAYADALDEEGKGGRAAFIRYQIENRIGHTADVIWPDEFFDWRREVPVGLHACASRIVYRRGLVESVRCPLAAWISHGPALCARQPVVRVEVTDKRPADGRGHDNRHLMGRFWWSVIKGLPAADAADAHWLPGELADRALWPAGDWYSFAHCTPIFDSAAAATAALSLACVQWARAECGLPPLPAPA